MKVAYFYKIIDIILISLLILSSGGLLFVFNRNICYAIFLGILLLAVFFSKKKLKTREVNSALGMKEKIVLDTEIPIRAKLRTR